MNLVRSLATVGGWTAVSRILGFLRDLLIAAVLGTGPLADAFFVALRLPNLFRSLFAEGAFSAAFVPLFAARLEQEGAAAARGFAEQVLALMAGLLMAFCILFILAMPWLMVVVAPGFGDDPAQYALAVELTRITFPYLFFIALSGLVSGVLNGLYRYAAPAAAPVILNLFHITGLVLIVPLWPQVSGQILSWGVAAAGGAQLSFLLLVAARAGMPLSLPRPRLTPGVRRLLALMGPGLLSSGALQINLLVGTMIATLQAGAVSYLYYADRLYQLPLALIGVALGNVLLPQLSRRLRSGDEQGAVDSLNRGIELGLLLTVPAAVALAVVPKTIIAALFQRGAFDAAATEATAAALEIYALGLPAFVLIKILQPPFFAREDTRTPLRFALLGVVINLAGSLSLFWVIGFLALPLATIVSSWVTVGLLLTGLHRRRFLRPDRRLRRRLPRALLASAAMGFALYAVDVAAEGSAWIHGERLPLLALLVASGLVAFGSFAFAFGAVRRSDFALLRRRQGPSGS